MHVSLKDSDPEVAEIMVCIVPIVLSFTWSIVLDNGIPSPLLC